MWFPFILFLVLAAFSVGGGLVAAQVAGGSFKEGKRQWVFFGLLLGCSLLPILWHYQWVIGFASSYGAYEPGTPVGFYPGLRRFQIVVPIGAFLLWSTSWLVARRLPLFSVGLPAIAVVAYYRTLRWVFENPPGVVLDNKPTIFLFILNTAAVFGLLAYVLAAWGWRPVARTTGDVLCRDD